MKNRTVSERMRKLVFVFVFNGISSEGMGQLAKEWDSQRRIGTASDRTGQPTKEWNIQ